MKISTRLDPVWSIENENEYADISFRHGSDDAGDTTRYWCTVVINSSFGAMSHHWYSMGEQWFEFMNQPHKQHYFMGKLSQTSIEEFDIVGTVKSVKSAIIDYRRERYYTKGQARHAYDTITDIDYGMNLDEFLEILSTLRGFQDDYHEYPVYRIKPWIKRFWEILWVPLTDEIYQQHKTTVNK